VQISAAETALASSGGVINLQACNYVINNPIGLKSGVAILGVAATKTTTNALIGGGDTLSGGTILIAGAATQALIANTTGSPTWPNGTISGIEIGNLSFQGFSGGGIVIGANGNGGASFSYFHDLDFYQCGSQSTIWAQNHYSMSIENFATINVERVRAHSPLNGFAFLVGNAVGDELGNSQFTDMLVDFETESSPSFTPMSLDRIRRPRARHSMRSRRISSQLTDLTDRRRESRTPPRFPGGPRSRSPRAATFRSACPSFSRRLPATFVLR
jgi:hypothetical protein